MRPYSWWRKQKRRVQKKYSLLGTWYLSPKETKEWFRNFRKARAQYWREKKKADKGDKE